jgi:hypothetical protein
VPRSVHRDSQGSAAQNRRIVVALLVSLLLHTPLFLASGIWRIGSSSEKTAPPLEVRIELQEGEDTKDDTPLADAPPAVEALAARATEPSDASEPKDVLEPSDAPAERVEEQLADAELPLAGPDAPASSAIPAPASGEALAPVDSLVAEAAVDDTPDELTPDEPDAADEPALAIDTVVATLAPAQEAVLARRLMREAHELLDSKALERHLTFEGDNGQFTAALTRQPAADATGVERVTVDITTEHGGERVQTSLQMKRLAFSHFTQLVHRWDPSVALHDDEIAGRFHSNSEILVTYDRKIAPRLLGKVTTAGRIRFIEEKGGRPQGRRPEIFVGGLETRSARIGLPRISLPVAHEPASPNADVQLMRSDTRIVFHADGDYDCIELASRAEARRRLAPDRATYIIGARHTALHVRGVVSGKVTVYSPERIVIEGDLTYAHAPSMGSDAGAYLGLVSDGIVEIAPADVTGPGDLEIHAAVYARKRFVVRNVRARGPATLFIYGSLTAGSLSETEPRYATRVEFDPRFERVRPPGFPETDRYEIETWDGRWRLAEAPELE